MRRHQAAADALMAISERLDRLNPHFWRRRELRYEQEDWSRIASRFDSGPDDEAEAPEFAAAVSSAVEANLIHLPQMHRLGALPPPMGAHVLLGLQHLTHRPVDRTTRGVQVLLVVATPVPPSVRRACSTGCQT